MKSYGHLLAVIIIATGLLINSQFVSGQTMSDRFYKIESFRVDRERFLPTYLLDSLVGKYQDGLAGAQVKEGKALKTSLSIDEKGATANVGFIGFTLGSLDIYSAFQLAGNGDDKFVSILKDNKYQQTLSGGGVFNIFYRNAGGSFYKRDRMLTYAQLDALNNQYLEETQQPAEDDDALRIKAQTRYVKNAEALANLYMASYCRAKSQNWDNVPEEFPTIESQGKSAIDTLKALGFLDKKFDEKKFCNASNDPYKIDKVYTANRHGFLEDELSMKKYVLSSEKMLMAAPWTRFNLSWFTFGINYNLKPQPIIDTTLKGEKHYLKTYNSEYVKAFLGWNFTSIHNWGHQLQITTSPTISFSTARNFQDDDKISISKNQPYTGISGDTITKTEYTSVGFEKAYDRKLTWSVEFPVTFLWNKDNIGIDLAVRIGGNDPLNDNVGARFGIYIPVEIKDDAPVWIEPVIRVGKLFNDSNMDFWKDNVTVGFNLSIALKKFSITGK